MSNITAILPESNTELIRSKIASILADELAGQKTLNVAAKATEEAKPTPDQNLINFYDLNISAIPDVVWEERFFRPQPSEFPLVNVVLMQAPFQEGTSHSGQMTVNRYQIEIYQGAYGNSEDQADRLATYKLHRLLATVRAILMSRHYSYLELPSIVGYRIVQNVEIGQPNNGAYNAKSIIFGKMDLLVKTHESESDLTGVVINEIGTTMKINDTEKGYYWEVIN